MVTPLINMEDVQGAVHNARLIMNAYLRSRIILVEDQEIRIVLSKRAPRFYYEAEEGKKKVITTIVLTSAGKDFVVIYNGNDKEATLLSNLSSDELYMLCSLVESFWKHIKTGDKTDIEDVECEIVK